PKGVALSHRAIKNFADWAADTFDITGNDKIASLTPFYFDLSVFDLFSGLSRGAMIHFIPDRLTFSPSRLTAWLSAHDMTVWYTVPSILSFIALKGALSITPLPRLKSILFAGEVFHTPQLLSLCEQLPAVNFYNLYGPTETNVCCYWPVDREQLKTGNPIPIGQAACGSALMIHPDTNELLVKSENNLSGYWQQGQLMPTLSADGYYSTGDGVRLNEKGEYCYQGRLDRMLKCSGYRVEPAEIERIILKNKQVKQCVVLGIKDKTSGQRPVAIVVLDNDATIAEIVKPTRQALPAYMQPCHYIALDVLPYLSHGKINYHSLQQQVDNL
ncbi:MAG: AMP-binding protein, partial [Methylococcales bacterium]|nr:AMP-binding protein [Methylococcales bacterium]